MKNISLKYLTNVINNQVKNSNLYIKYYIEWFVVEYQTER